MHNTTSFQSQNHAVTTKSMLEDTVAQQVKLLLKIDGFIGRTRPHWLGASSRTIQIK